MPVLVTVDDFEAAMSGARLGRASGSAVALKQTRSRWPTAAASWPSGILLCIVQTKFQ